MDIVTRGTSACVDIDSENDSSSCCLEIASSQTCDTGRYSVIARNCHGVVKASVRVDVEEEAYGSVNEEMAVIVPVIYDSTLESVSDIIPMKEESGFDLDNDSKETDQKNENLQKINMNLADTLGNESGIEYCIHSAIDASTEDEKIRSEINKNGNVKLTETDLKPENILIEIATNVDENARKLDLTVKDDISEEMQTKEPEFKVIEAVDLPGSVVLLTDSKTIDDAVIKADVSEKIHTKESELKVSAVVDLTERVVKPDISIMEEISTSETEKSGEVILKGSIGIVADEQEVDAKVKEALGLKENERPSKTVTIKDHLTDCETTDQAVIKEDISEEIQTKVSKLQVNAVINLVEKRIEPETIIVKEISTSETDKHGKVKLVGDISMMENMLGMNAEVKEAVGMKENERPLETDKLLTEFKATGQTAIEDDISEEIQTKESEVKVSAVVDLPQKSIKPDIIIVQETSTNESERDGEVILTGGISIVADKFGVNADANVKEGVRLKKYESPSETVVLLTDPGIAVINDDILEDIQAKGSELQVSADGELTEKATEPEIIIVKEISTSETEIGKVVLKESISIMDDKFLVDTEVKDDVGLKEKERPSDIRLVLTDSGTKDQAVINAYISEEIPTEEIKLKISAIVDLTEKTNEPDIIIVQDTSSTNETEKDGEAILEGDISIMEDMLGVDAEVREDVGLREEESLPETVALWTDFETTVIKTETFVKSQTSESELKVSAVVNLIEKVIEPDAIIVNKISTNETETQGEVTQMDNISIVEGKFGVNDKVKEDVGLKENDRPSDMVVLLAYSETTEQAVIKVDIFEEMQVRESELKPSAIVELTEKATEPEIIIVKEISISETERDGTVILEGDINIVGDKFGVVAEMKEDEGLKADEVAKLKFETLAQFEGDKFEETSLMGKTSATANNIEFTLVENIDTVNAIIAKLISPERELSSFCQLESDDLDFTDEANDELMDIEKVELTSVYARVLTADEMPSITLLSKLQVHKAEVSESLPVTDGVDFQMKALGGLDGVSGSDSDRENFSETDLAHEILKINLKSRSTHVSEDDAKTAEPDICELDTVQKLHKIPVEDDKPLCETSTKMKPSADSMIQDDAFTQADGLAYSG